MRLRGDEQRRRAENDDPLAGWDGFAAAVRARLEHGRSTFGDQSFERDPADLLAEIAEEALGLAVWGFVLWVRTQALAAKFTGQLGGGADG